MDVGQVAVGCCFAHIPHVCLFEDSSILKELVMKHANFCRKVWHGECAKLLPILIFAKLNPSTIFQNDETCW